MSTARWVLLNHRSAQNLARALPCVPWKPGPFQLAKASPSAERVLGQPLISRPPVPQSSWHTCFCCGAAAWVLLHSMCSLGFTCQASQPSMQSSTSGGVSALTRSGQREAWGWRKGGQMPFWRRRWLIWHWREKVALGKQSLLILSIHSLFS